MTVVLLEQGDVLPLIEVPRIGQQSLRVLRSEEHKVGEQPRGPAVSINERVDSYGLGVSGNAEFAGIPVVGVLPPVADRVQRSAEFYGDQFRGNADVQLALAVNARPSPDVAVEPPVQFARSGRSRGGLPRASLRARR